MTDNTKALSKINTVNDIKNMEDAIAFLAKKTDEGCYDKYAKPQHLPSAESQEKLIPLKAFIYSMRKRGIFPKEISEILKKGIRVKDGIIIKTDISSHQIYLFIRNNWGKEFGRKKQNK